MTWSTPWSMARVRPGVDRYTWFGASRMPSVASTTGIAVCF